MTLTETSVLPQIKATHVASSAIKRLSSSQKTTLLNHLAEVILANEAGILLANALDLARKDDADPMKDRLRLTPQRIQSLAEAVREVALLPDPTNQLLQERTLPNGITLSKISVPLGVVGVIYESRPNVTIDVSAICLRSGNAVVLRGGSDAFESNSFLVALIQQVLVHFGLPTEAVTLLPANRELVKEMLTATRFIDVIIPRGSDRLIQFVRQNSLVPTIETGAGVVHVYVHTEADLAKAQGIVLNSKVSRPAVCNALDTIVIDEAIADSFLPMLKEDFLKWNVEVFADEIAFNILAKAEYPLLQAATEADFGREFLDYKCSVKIVTNIAEAIAHVGEYSSRHSEAIVSENSEAIEQYLNEIDAAAVYANTSTRFTDGGEFGLGAEIGISTQKLHARGPFALEKLVTEKWIGRGNGQVRW